jgi:hypothetical protein
MANEIYRAESARVSGKFGKALMSARENGEIKPASLNTLTTDELENKMRYWRLWTVTLHSLFSKTWNGNQAADYLQEARDVIITYYQNEVVQKAAARMTHDAESHEYQMLSEMQRDKAKQMEKLAALTGNNVFLQTAVCYYQRAIQSAIAGSSASFLTTMEEFVAERKLGQRTIDFGPQSPFTQAYLQVVELSPQAGGADRKAAASWMYIHEAFLANNREAAKFAFVNLEQACADLKVSWVKRYFIKDLASPIISLCRKKTFHGYTNQMVV